MGRLHTVGHDDTPGVCAMAWVARLSTPDAGLNMTSSAARDPGSGTVAPEPSAFTGNGTYRTR